MTEIHFTSNGEKIKVKIDGTVSEIVQMLTSYAQHNPDFETAINETSKQLNAKNVQHSDGD